MYTNLVTQMGSDLIIFDGSNRDRRSLSIIRRRPECAIFNDQSRLRAPIWNCTGTASMNFIAYANEAANGNDFENRYLISEAINAKRMLQILFFFFFFKFCVNSVSKCLPFSSGRRFYFRPVPPSIHRGLAGYQTAGCPLNPTRSGLKSSRITCSIRKSLILL